MAVADDSCSVAVLLGTIRSLRGHQNRSQTFPAVTLNADLQGAWQWIRSTVYRVPFDQGCNVCMAWKAYQKPTMSACKPYKPHSWGEEGIGEGLRQRCGLTSAEQHSLLEPRPLGELLSANCTASEMTICILAGRSVRNVSHAGDCVLYPSTCICKHRGFVHAPALLC